MVHSNMSSSSSHIHTASTATCCSQEIRMKRDWCVMPTSISRHEISVHLMSLPQVTLSSIDCEGQVSAMIVCLLVLL